MNLNEVYEVVEDVRTREEQFGLLLVSKVTPALALNDDMKTIWSFINGENTYGQIIKNIQALYPEDNVEEKVAEIFGILTKIGLIRVKGA